MQRLKLALGLSTFGLVSSSVAAPPPLFTQLYRSALESSESVRLKKEELTQTREQKSQATGTLYPTLQFIGSKLWQDHPTSSIGANISPSTQKTARLNGRQFIFQGTSEYALYRQANINVEQKDAELKQAQDDLFLNLADQYFAIQLRDIELKRIDEELAIYDQQIKELKKRVSIGRSRSSDLLSAEAARSGLYGTKLTRITERAALIRELQSLTGVQTGDTPFTPWTEPFGDLPALDQYLNHLQDRPQIKAAQLRSQSVEEEISAQRGRHFPTLDVSGNYWLERPGALSNVSWDVSLNLTIPIYAGGNVQSEVRESTSRFRAAQISEGLSLRLLRTQIENLYENTRLGTGELEALKAASDAAHRATTQLQRDFRLGLTNLLDVLQTVRLQQESDRSHDAAENRLRLNRLKLEYLSNRYTAQI